ncbi:MAG: class I SAM-dependent methyltransferase [Bacteroidota bacterium]
MHTRKLNQQNTSLRDASIDKWFASDNQFHQLYPAAVHTQASMHWTPLHIARKAAEFLAVEKQTKILDIGSGTGKFCLAAAYYYPDASYYGIEQRGDMVAYADTARAILSLPQVSFIHENILRIDLGEYDHFYFFNAFFENLDDSYKIDDSVTYSRELYAQYSRYLFKQLDKKPSGTRLATFHSTENEIPGEYHQVGSAADDLLKFWIKI